jgi:hypothetical protein
MSAATSAPTNAPPQRGPNCWQCRFFAVSHNPHAPYACRAMGFQSRALPALEVLRADGHFCRAFEAKASHGSNP